MKEIMNHLNKNHGVYDLIFTFVVAIVALLSLLITIHPLEKKADIQLYTDELGDIINLSSKFIPPSFSLYLFNGGTAPCFDVLLTTPIFIQDGEMILPETRTIPALVYTLEQKTTFYLGVINPDETIKIILEPIDLSKDQLEYITLINPSILKVECVGDSSTKKIFFKK